MSLKYLYVTLCVSLIVYGQTQEIVDKHSTHVKRSSQPETLSRLSFEMLASNVNRTNVKRAAITQDNNNGKYNIANATSAFIHIPSENIFHEGCDLNNESDEKLPYRCSEKNNIVAAVNDVIAVDEKTVKRSSDWQLAATTLKHLPLENLEDPYKSEPVKPPSYEKLVSEPHSAKQPTDEPNETDYKSSKNIEAPELKDDEPPPPSSDDDSNEIVNTTLSNEDSTTAAATTTFTPSSTIVLNSEESTTQEDDTEFSTSLSPSSPPPSSSIKPESSEVPTEPLPTTTTPPPLLPSSPTTTTKQPITTLLPSSSTTQQVETTTTTQVVEETTFKSYPWQHIAVPHALPPDYQETIGERVDPTEIKWLVFIRIADRNTTIYCSGAILTPYKIVTAATCLFHYPSKRPYKTALLFIGGGRSDKADYVIPISLIQQVDVHPSFTIYDPYLQNNIAVITLYEPITFSSRIGSIEVDVMPTKRNAELYMVGFGRYDDGSPVDKSRGHPLTILPSSNCTYSYGPYVCSKSVLVSIGAKSLASSICRVESGAPISYHGGWFSKPKLIAIASFVSANGCRSGGIDGHTYVAAYYTWLTRVLRY